MDELKDMAQKTAETTNKWKKQTEELIKMTVKERWKYSISDIKRRPWQYIAIPIIAGMVGYVTNYIGVKMLFYPLQYFGFSWMRWAQQPFGLFGWQGVVPAKRFLKAATLIDLETTKGIDIPNIFSRLDHKDLSHLLTGSIKKSIYFGFVPNSIFRFFLRKASRNVTNNIEYIADFR